MPFVTEKANGAVARDSGPETRYWRNAFYGLPPAYKPCPSNTNDAKIDADLDCRPLRVDAASFYRALDRRRKESRS